MTRKKPNPATKDLQDLRYRLDDLFRLADEASKATPTAETKATRTAVLLTICGVDAAIERARVLAEARVGQDERAA